MVLHAPVVVPDMRSGQKHQPYFLLRVPALVYDLQSLIAGADLILHTAGPFQQSKNYNVIEAAIETKTPYIDVCDDTHYSEG